MEGKTAAIVDIYKLSHMTQSSALLDTAHYNRQLHTCSQFYPAQFHS